MEEDARAGGGAEVREEDLAGHGCHGPEPAREEADPRRRPLREGEIWSVGAPARGAARTRGKGAHHLVPPARDHAAGRACRSPAAISRESTGSLPPSLPFVTTSTRPSSSPRGPPPTLLLDPPTVAGFQSGPKQGLGGEGGKGARCKRSSAAVGRTGPEEHAGGTEEQEAWRRSARTARIGGP